MDGNTGQTERKPNSVLFSLKELRRIEEDRVLSEEEQQKQKEEEEKRAKEEAERQAIEGKERARQEEQERVRQEQEQVERKAREEQLRLQEAETRARIEAETDLQKARQEAELKAKALEKKVPWIPIGIAIVLLLAGLAGLGVYSMKQKEQRELALKKARVAELARQKALKQWEEKERQMEEKQQRLNMQINDLDAKLSSAKNDAERDLLRKQLRDQQERARQLQNQRARQRTIRKRKAKKLKGFMGGSDPLQGL